MIRTRRMRVLGLTSPLLVAMLAAVCTPATVARPDPVTSPRVLGTSVVREPVTAPARQACTLLTVTEVERATGRSVIAAAPDPDAIGCTWSLVGGAAVVVAVLDPAGPLSVDAIGLDDDAALTVEDELQTLARRRLAV